jgi:sugar phosphate isomerase/epimerase
MIRFGAPVFLDETRAAGAGESHGAVATDPVALAKAHSALGYTAAYAPQVSLDEPDRIREVRKAFADEGVMIAEVGYWDNLVDTDAATRQDTRRLMLEAMALAEELGARCAVDIFGSYCHGNGNAEHAARNFSEEAFDEAVELARYFIDAVQPRTAHFAYEIFPFNVVDSAAEIERLIHAVDRTMFGVHLDLVNLINCPRAYWTSGDIMRECVRRFGERIVAAHCKDIKMREPAISVILEEVPPGQGAMDFATALTELDALPQNVPYMIEHLSSAEEYAQAAAHIRAIATSVGMKI